MPYRTEHLLCRLLGYTVKGIDGSQCKVMSQDKEKLAVFGLGIIGSRCAKLLADADYSVSVWNRTPRESSGLLAKRPADAARKAEILLFYLQDGGAVRSVFAEIEPFLRPEHIVINHSTVDLETTHWLGSQCRERGCGFIDAPFTGSREAAEHGELVYYLGGDESLLERVSTILDVTSKQQMPVGRVGDATIIKIATNMISAATVQTLSEALVLVQRLGLPAKHLAAAIKSNACCSPLALNKLEIIEGGDYSPHFSLKNMCKDSDFALNLGDRTDTNLPVTSQVYQCLAKLCDAGYGDQDYAYLYEGVDQEAQEE